MAKTSKKYPEHKKLQKVHKESQAIGAFLEWLSSEGIYLAEKSSEGTSLRKLYSDPNMILAVYYGINLTTLEKEKRAMLEELK